MDPDELSEEEIRRRAHEVMNNWFRKLFVGHPDTITVEFLMEMHPGELDREEAAAYKEFLSEHTIDLKGCYGNGRIMWPRWQAFIAEINSL